MDAIRCANCESVWSSFIARDLMTVSNGCLRCGSQRLELVDATRTSGASVALRVGTGDDRVAPRAARRGNNRSRSGGLPRSLMLTVP